MAVESATGQKSYEKIRVSDRDYGVTVERVMSTTTVNCDGNGGECADGRL